MIALGRPYTPDFFGWFDDFSTTGGGFDALGALARAPDQPRPRTSRCPQRRRCRTATSTSAARARPRRRSQTGRTSSARRSRTLCSCEEDHRATGDVQVRRAASRSRSSWRRRRGRVLLAGASARRRRQRDAPTRSCSTTPSGWSRAATSGWAASRPARRPSSRSRSARASRARAVVDGGDHPAGLRRLPRGRQLHDRPQSLIGEYYVDCQPGNAEQKLPSDGKGTVPVEQTSSTIPADLVHNVMRRPYRERLRLIIAELGTGLAGRPEDLHEVLRRAHPGLRETSKVLADPRRPEPDHQELHQGLRHGRRRAREQQARRGPLGRRGRRDRRDLGHAPRAELRQSFRKLPDVPRRAGAHDGAPRRAGRRADPAARGPPAAAAPELETLPHPPRPVRRGLPARAPVARQGAQEGHGARPRGHRGDRRAAPSWRRTPSPRQAAAPVPPDDRRPQARSRGRPAREGGLARPRPTRPRSATAGGFTGLESIWNYFFWQAPGAQRLRLGRPRAAQLALGHAVLAARQRRRIRTAQHFKELLAVARPRPARA